MPKQPAIPGLCDAMKKKVTRLEQFLAEMDAVVPWRRYQSARPLNPLCCSWALPVTLLSQRRAK